VGLQRDTPDPELRTSAHPECELLQRGNRLRARSMCFRRTLAKNLRSIPGRKNAVLLFLRLSALPNANPSCSHYRCCNKSNVAVYSLDVRGLQAPTPKGGAARTAPHSQSVACGKLSSQKFQTDSSRSLVLASTLTHQRPRRRNRRHWWWRRARPRWHGGLRTGSQVRP